MFMMTKYLKLLGCSGLAVTLFVACGDLEEKKIIGHDVKAGFLATHNDTFTASTGNSVRFEKSGKVSLVSSTTVNIKVYRTYDNNFYVSDSSDNYAELVDDSSELLKVSTARESQTAEVNCVYNQPGILEKLQLIPREYPKEKIHWSMSNIMSNYPDANYGMFL